MTLLVVKSDPLIDLSKAQTKRVPKQILEKDIELPVKRYAVGRHNMLAEKFTSPSKRSVPDDLFTNAHGFMFFIEFKAPGKGPSEKQALDHKKRRSRGVTVFVVDDIEQGKQIIDEQSKVRPYYN